MPEQNRPPRFDDIAALSKKPPASPPRPRLVSPFAVELNPLERVRPEDFPALPAEAPEPGASRGRLGSPGTQSTQNTQAIPPTLDTHDTQKGTQTTGLATQAPGRLGTQGTRPTRDSVGTQEGLGESLEQTAKGPWKDKRDQLNLKQMPKDLLEEVRRYCFENRVTIKDFAVRAFEAALGTQDTRERPGTQGRNLPTLDDDLDEDDRTIIELYEKATGNTWNERDQAVLRQVRDFGPSCVKLGIATGRNRYRQQIKSFRFFENNIREAAAMQPDKIERELNFQMTMLRRRVRGV
jgi:hypothetical protein